jgi:hypothetical protein
MYLRFLAILAAFGVVAAANAQYVYNSRDGQAATVSGTLLATGATDSNFWGDQVTLAGTDRTVTLLEQVFQFNPAAGDTNNFTFTFDLQFNTVSGTTVGASFFSASYTAAPVAGTAVAAFLYGFPISNVVVPDTFVYSFRVHRTAGSNQGTIGMQAHNSPPSVGFSDPTFFWSQNPTTGVWSQSTFTGNINSNFRARITAVPEPASMAALAIGALAMVRRRRNKRA